MEAVAIKSEAYQGNDTYIESMSYDLDELKIIVVADSNKRIEVMFYQPVGFRCLDEGDLLEFWENPEIINNWLVSIKDSGWYEQECARDGFLSKNIELNEYLVKGNNECINVLDSNQPKVTVL